MIIGNRVSVKNVECSLISLIVLVLILCIIFMTRLIKTSTQFELISKSLRGKNYKSKLEKKDCY